MRYRKFLKYLLFLMLVMSLGMLVGFSSKKNSAKIIGEPVVEFEAGENSFLTHSMVNKLLIQNNETVKNKAKSTLDLYGLENSVLENPYVEKAAVFFTIDGVLKTIVKQRKPIARIVSKGNSYYIDKQGAKVPLSDNFSARVLLVSGVETDEDIKEIVPLISYILNDSFLQKEVVGIHKSNRGEYQFSARSGNYKIDFGKLTEIEVKFKKLKAFYNKAFLDKTIENYKTINVKYHNQVVGIK